MKANKKSLALQRRALDQKFKTILKLNQIQKPRRGWIKAIRESIMMTTRQLAARMEISHVAVVEMEKREASKTITLETLERAANSLNCDLIYALIPRSDSLQTMLNQQAIQSATLLSKSTTHTMGLEDQAVTPEETKEQIEELAQDLIISADPRIWGVPLAKLKKEQK